MLLFVTIVQTVAAIALLSLLGQWVLGLLAGAGRESNLFYQLLGVLTRPFTRLTRLLTPRIVLDRHIPLATFALLLMAYVASTVARIAICIEIGVHLCR
ncbi:MULTISPECIES: hypothetical protein [Caldimonas]|uniref:hypothetical protein n=1 Tax=Caldimonas TaxID=196013 RepID=UPI00039BABE5|nr:MULTISPECIES: hypothetical protein [Caldimonas]MCX7659392.1 hypothetical protein [Caldimonas manganoxidans]GIX25144.1 MAG: hypothetical protein KatS3mg122_2375 [Caldimonas sp.]